MMTESLCILWYARGPSAKVPANGDTEENHKLRDKTPIQIHVQPQLVSLTFSAM